MQENQEDAERHNISDREYIGFEERLCDGATIGKLIAYHLAINKPTHDDTCEETTYGQHELGSQEIAEIHQRHTEHMQVVGSGRERTEHGDARADHRQNPRGILTRQIQFLVEKRRTNLVHGDGGRQGSEYQQGVKQT